MWLVFLVTGLPGAVWIWPALRVPKLWFSLCLASLLGTAVWLGLDLQDFLARTERPSRAGVRILYVLLRETDMPAIPFAIGCLAAGLFSRRGRQLESCENRAQSEEHPAVSTG